MSREYPQLPVLGVAAVVFDAQDRVLLVRRAKEPGKGQWGIPGGGVELGETLLDALKRELLEETGIHVTLLNLITLVERVFRDGEGRVRYHFIVAEYVCAHQEGALRPSDDVDRAVWVRSDRLSGYALPEITLEIIRRGRRMFLETGEGRGLGQGL